jgi:hypothetical protein
MSNALAEWLARQPKGASTRLMHETKLAWKTVWRAKKGAKVGLRVAILISRATGGAVPVSALTDENVLEDSEPRSAA